VTEFDDLPECDEMGEAAESGTVLVHTRQEREQAVRSWLLLAAEGLDTTGLSWQKAGITLLRCGVLFAAVRMEAELVRAAAGSDDHKAVNAFLDNALHGGPVFIDQHSARYYALVPASAAQRREWCERRHAPAAELLGHDSLLGVPRPEFTSPDEHFSYWCVPMDGPGDLCPVEAVSQLVTYGRYRLAQVEAARGEG